MASKSRRFIGTRVAVPPSFLNLVVGFFQPAHGAGGQDHMRAGLGQGDGRGAADAARCARDERDPPCPMVWS